MNIIFALNLTYIHSIEGKNAHFTIPNKKHDDAMAMIPDTSDKVTKNVVTFLVTVGRDL